jgi:hypothetical protein
MEPSRRDASVLDLIGRAIRNRHYAVELLGTAKHPAPCHQLQNSLSANPRKPLMTLLVRRLALPLPVGLIVGGRDTPVRLVENLGHSEGTALLAGESGCETVLHFIRDVAELDTAEGQR